MSYTKQTWKAGDEVTSAKLNHMEDGINNVAGEVAELAGAIENNGDNINSNENPFAQVKEFNENNLSTYSDYYCGCTSSYFNLSNQNNIYTHRTDTNQSLFSEKIFVEYKYSNVEFVDWNTEREILTSYYTLTSIPVKNENAIIYGAKQIENNGEYSYIFDDNIPFMIKVIYAQNEVLITYQWKNKYADSIRIFCDKIKYLKPNFQNAIEKYYDNVLKDKFQDIATSSFDYWGPDDYRRNSRLTLDTIIENNSNFTGIYTGTLHIHDQLSYTKRLYNISFAFDEDWETTYQLYSNQKIYLTSFDPAIFYGTIWPDNEVKLILTRRENMENNNAVFDLQLEIKQNNNDFQESSLIFFHLKPDYDFSNEVVQSLNKQENLTKILGTPVKSSRASNLTNVPFGNKVQEYIIENPTFNVTSEIIDGFTFKTISCNFPYSAISSFKNNMYINTETYAWKLNFHLNSVPRYATYFSSDYSKELEITNSVCELRITQEDFDANSNSSELPSWAPTFLSIVQYDEEKYVQVNKPFQDAIKFVLNKENITSNAPLMVHKQDAWTLDKTYAEVKEAFLAGRQVIIVGNNDSSYSPVLQIQQNTHEVFTRGTYYFASNENDYLVVPD